ncbi:MAG: tRNA(Glu)-specific nuclease WapA precursor [Verrucomicrobia bacterium ADurb.Bin345]|nr:MAG: tRNA(Glu)-specific nuclease WapA precursor [Verrucomicrobia bacterium ADurb.Bin345]
MHYATSFKQSSRIAVQGEWNPTPLLDYGGQPAAPYQCGVTIGIPSFHQDEYHSYVNTNWNEVAPWPTAPGTMSVSHVEFFFRNSTANVVRLSFMGQWLTNPTNALRGGPLKHIQIFLWSFDDVYGMRDVGDAPWIKGFGMGWTPFRPRIRKAPAGCGGCVDMGLPVFRVNMATLNPVIQDTDFAWSGLGPDVRLARTYSGDPSERGIFGNGWTFNCEAPLIHHLFGHQVVKPDGGQVFFYGSLGTNDAYPPWRGHNDDLSSVLSNDWMHYQLRDRATDLKHHYMAPALIWPSTDYGTRHPLRGIEDRNGNRVEMNWTNGLLETVTDAAGRQTVFSYSPGGLCTNILLPNGAVLLYAYDASSNLVQTRDADGNTTTYSYDGENRITAMSTEGRTWTFAYWGSGNLMLQSVTDPLGRTNRYSFSGDLDNRQAGFTDGRTNETWFQTADGSLKSETDAALQSRTYQYDTNGFPTNTTSPRGFSTAKTYDDRRNLASVTHPDGARIAFAYDGIDRLTHITNALGGVTRFDRDARGNVIRITTPAGRVTGMGYDALGQLVAVTNPAGEVTRFSYNAFGRVAVRTDPGGYRAGFAYDSAGMDAAAITNERGFVTQFQYDANRRLTRITHPDGTRVDYDYDCCGLAAVVNENRHTNRIERNALLQKTAFVDGEGARTDYVYDGNGNLIMSTGPLGRVTWMAYDKADRIETITDRSGGLAWYGYDANGNIVAASRAGIYVSPPGITVSTVSAFSYDMNDRMNSFKYHGQSTSNRLYRDALGRLTNRVNARGQSIGRSYDPDGLLVGVSRPGSADAFVYDAVGRLIVWTGSTGNAGYTFDARGLITRIRYGDGHEVGFTYSPTRRIETMTYPGGSVITYQRDSRDRVTNMACGPLAISFTCDGVGQVRTVARSNGSASQFAYNRAGRMTNLAHQVPAGTLLNLRVARNVAGEATNVVKTAGLVPWNPPFLPTNLGLNIFGPLYQINGAACQVDGDGNTTGVPAPFDWTAEYDAGGRLTTLRRAGETNTYAYDGFDRCVRIGQGSEVRNLHWDREDRLLFETDGAGVVTALYVYRERDLVAMSGAGKGWHFYHFDHNGNTVAMTDEAGAISALYRYLPYGASGYGYARVRNPFTFAGRYGVLDEGADLHYMRNRFYHAGLRRFLTPDPIGFLGGLNLYAYAGGNPVDSADPSGHFPWAAHFEEDLEDGWAVEYSLGAAQAIAEDKVGLWGRLLDIIERRKEREALEKYCGDSPPPRKPDDAAGSSAPESYDDQAAGTAPPAVDEAAVWAEAAAEGWDE